ncbi:phage portal protein [Eupransor demetentiae]|uniref:Phage portal protein n=1 Tax=Eupransor demetentiae TaxID=3109584 RepID=A0ABP0ESP2_9LACO|nr:hypothetical protein R54876_GBNLAHCA_00687 [Lactobacillaceae bacterium LMG 33000]
MTDVNVNNSTYNNLKNALMVYQEDASNLTAERVGQFIKHHYDNQRPRMQMLDSYYKGVDSKINDEVKRRRDEYGADVRISHPFAQEIADFHTSFSVGNAITISVNDDEEHPTLEEVNAVNDVDALYYDLFSDMSKFGRSFANVYRDQDERIEKIVQLDPQSTFIIYSQDVSPKPLMAVRYNPISVVGTNGETTATIQYIIETWTDDEYTRSSPVDMQSGIADGYTIAERQPLVTMPVVEFWNNSQRMGDYDGVISLIDAYDASQSDTANYMQDSNDAMLVIQGDISDLLDSASTAIDPEDKDYLDKLVKAKKDMLADIRKTRTLVLQSGISATGQQTNVSASYLTKSYDVNGVEAYKNRLYKNIHSFSRTPDVSDENFASNASGVAMQYKQLGVIQLAKTKRRMFEKGLNRIYRIVQALEQAVSGPWNLDADDINFMFTDNLPTDDVNTIQTLQQSGATFPQAYLDRFAPGITPDEMQGLRDEQSVTQNAMQAEMVRLHERDNAVDDEDIEEEDE